ncbi:MAG: protein-methionine-sulfoxide reductase catalytic subunit MsrP [Rhodocyclaceae bacterium]
MLIRRPTNTVPSEITPRDVFALRRQFLANAAAVAGGALLGLGTNPGHAAPRYDSLPKSPYSTHENPNSLRDITRYNNYTEFGFEKTDPAENAPRMKTRPWTVQIDGLVAKPRTLDIEDILKQMPLEERVYRLRCVETWSMVIPWVGFPLEKLIRLVEPLGSAKFVEFTTLADAETMPMVRRPVLDWPYREALRLDEALHPLTLIAVGLYGEELPNQNGAPLRLVVPWKYGFKSAKSLVRLRFTEARPETTWNKAQPDEYGFYANVNPAVSHPRWSQARERRIGEFFRRDSLPFNGYADQVAHLYAGMDLRVAY